MQKEQNTSEEPTKFVSDEDIVTTGENLWNKYQQQREERRQAGNKGEPKFVSDEDILYRRSA